MFIGYLDDSGRFNKKKQTFQVLAVVLVHDEWFTVIEGEVGECVSDLLPEDRIEKFEEFHAWELYGGYGIFDGIEQEARFATIRRLLSIVSNFKLPVIYGAVDIQRLEASSFAS